MLPLVTAGFAVWLGKESASARFWACALVGSALVVAHGIWIADMQFEPADLLMMLAILACGLGYAEGGRLSRRLGALAVIAWALILSLPLSLPATLILGWLTRGQWLALRPGMDRIRLCRVFSMFVGFHSGTRASPRWGSPDRPAPIAAIVSRPGAGGLAAGRKYRTRHLGCRVPRPDPGLCGPALGLMVPTLNGFH
jgi:hypothetical protein